MTPVVVLISGRGSNLGALIRRESTHYRIVGVISNRPDAPGLQLAAEAGIPVDTVDHRAFASREAFDFVLAEKIRTRRAELIVLAGFMRILGRRFVTRFEGRMINIHPSLLPEFQGTDTHRRAIEAGRTEHGASVHFVTAELDSGPVIARTRIPILADDTPASLAARLLPHEHRLLPEVVELIGQGRIEWRDGHVFFDAKKLETPLEIQT